MRTGPHHKEIRNGPVLYSFLGQPETVTASFSFFLHSKKKEKGRDLVSGCSLLQDPVMRLAPAAELSSED